MTNAASTEAMMNEEGKNQIERIKDGETGPGDAERSQPRGQAPVTGSKDLIDLSSLPSSAKTGHGDKDKGER